MSIHAAVDHTLAWPLETKATPVVAVLAVRDVPRLLALVDDLEGCGSEVIKYYEPDIGGELASIATISGPKSILRHLPLLFHRGEVRT